MKDSERDQHPQKPIVSLRQQKVQKQRLVLKCSGWQSPLVGYAICPFFIGIAAIADLTMRRFGLNQHTTSAPFYLADIVLAWLWGVGPALVGIVLGFMLLDALIIPPYGLFTFNGWGDMAIYLPFILTQLVVVLITAQRERAKREALARAQELAEINQTLAQSNDHLEQLNNHLSEVNQLKDYFLAQASHELKTPVTTIRGQTQLALRRLTKPQHSTVEALPLPAHLEKIEEQTRRLQTLIEDLLDISSLNLGKISLRLVPCNITVLCSKVIEDQRALSGRCIELELPSEPLTLQADSQRLTQVIINLVSNAVKYSPEDSIVHVCARLDSTDLILTFHNDGSTIPQELQLHIFDPFYRTPAAKRSSTPGSGLGLAISKEIVERHKGKISIESSEEKGTTFFVRLPLQQNIRC